MNISFNNNQEAIQALKIIQEYLESNIDSNNSSNDTFKEQEEMFLTLMSGLTQISDYWIDSNDNAIIVKDTKNKFITFTYNNFCSNFEVYNINIQQLRDFLTIMVEKHLGLTEYIAVEVI